MNLGSIVDRSARYFSSRPAVCSDGIEISYGSLNQHTNRVATALVNLGISPGDPVALCASNSPDWIVFYYGAIKAGAVAVTLPGQLTDEELVPLIDDCRPRCIFTSGDRTGALNSLRRSGLLETVIGPGGDMSLDTLCARGCDRFTAIDRDRSDAAAILFTGGTTGIPKGVVLSHENIITAINNVAFNERSYEKDRSLCFLPFNHVFGQMHIMNATLLSGGCLELIPAFDIERVMAIIAAGRVTKLYAVPTVYVRLLGVDHLHRQLGAVRYCFSAAASMAVELVRKWKDHTGLAIHEAYGMTETASMVTYNHYYRHVTGSVGTPVGTTEVQIRDKHGNRVACGSEGEICVRGRNVMAGYLNRPAETRAAFWGEWLRTGDIGRIDADGYLFIVDRLKDMIITGGENVYPREVEEILFTLPDVEECAVIGLPDAEWGERVVAMIVAAPGYTMDIDAIRSTLKNRLSPYKVPKEIRIIDRLPKSPAGKILKRDLRKAILDCKIGIVR